MSTARMTTQLVCQLPARVGVLAEVTDAVRKAGVNVMAISAYERDGSGKFLMVTDDNAKAKEALVRLDCMVEEKSVLAVEMPDEAGALQQVADRLAKAGINIRYVYGTTCSVGMACSCDTAAVILRTDDDDKALQLING